MATIGTIIVVTTEDDRFAGARRAAIDRARTEGAALVLYDLDAGGDLSQSGFALLLPMRPRIKRI